MNATDVKRSALNVAWVFAVILLFCGLGAAVAALLM